MFDISNPQKRERLLVILAFIALTLIAVVVVPGQFTEAKKKREQRDKLEKDITNYQQTVRNKETIERRLLAFEGQTLAFGNSEALTRYQNWLRDLATIAGIRDLSSPNPVRSGGPQNIYTKYTFSLNGTATLPQIAEFLRRFHRTDYLHIIQSVKPTPAGANRPGIFNVMFKIEALSLPQVSLVNVPSSELNTAPITAEEQQMLTEISTRSILSEYAPPAPPPPTGPTVSAPPPPPPFDEVRFHVVRMITESGGKSQCWICNLLTDRVYSLSEGESFTLAYVPDGAATLARMRCTIKKIDAKAQRLQIELGGGLFSILCGQNFDEIEPVEPDPSAAAPEPEAKENVPKTTVPETEPMEEPDETAEPDDEEMEGAEV